MKLVGLVFILFVLAFAGLAAGMLMKRRGLRSGCGHVPNEQHDCRCESELDQSMRGQKLSSNCCETEMKP